MSRRRTVTPAKAVLAFLGLATAALMGVPGVVSYVPPRGSLAGTVVDLDGEPVPDATVALFHEKTLGLVAIARTDLLGRFAFQEPPDRYEVFARPPETSPLVGAWAPGRPSSGSQIDLVLAPGRPCAVRVQDETGEPLRDVEIRVYDARAGLDDPAVVANRRSGPDGTARVLLPRHAHLAALGLGRVPVWVRDLEDDPDDGDLPEITLVLPRGHDLYGRVVDPDGSPLEGVVVSAWSGSPSRSPAWTWSGFATTSAQGTFSLIAPVPTERGEKTLLRALDPNQHHLPLEREVRPGRPRFLELALRSGTPLEVRCVDVARSPVPSRVWVWSAGTPSGSSGAWSFGALTDGEGVLRTAAGGTTSLAVEPTGGLEPARVWHRPLGDPGQGEEGGEGVEVTLLPPRETP